MATSWTKVGRFLGIAVVAGVSFTPSVPPAAAAQDDCRDDDVCVWVDPNFEGRRTDWSGRTECVEQAAESAFNRSNFHYLALFRDPSCPGGDFVQLGPGEFVDFFQAQSYLIEDSGDPTESVPPAG